MFKLLFAKLKRLIKPKEAMQQTQHTLSIYSDPATAAFMQALEEQKKTDPLIGAKIGGKEIYLRMLDAIKDERGVHIESLLCVLSSLAGYSCQASLRAQALEKGLPETAAFNVIETKNGKKYFFGDPLNQALAESQYSIWGLAAGAAQHAGCAALPDITDIFKHVSGSIGSGKFGIPRLPAKHQVSDTPTNYLKACWPAFLPLIKQFCPNPAEWPLLFGYALQEAIQYGKEVLAPDMALTIIMESAIPMSKIDLATA